VGYAKSQIWGKENSDLIMIKVCATIGIYTVANYSMLDSEY